MPHNTGNRVFRQEGHKAEGRLERYTHALAGATICLCGTTIRFLGL
ncbi:MAG: hypothetical protein NUV44_03060 [Candidatus Scalindua sp.]|nr:hypothetical protein [Candidatus Scalindua sp.]